MIVPTPEHDAMFLDDGIPFRERMVAYIHAHFGGLLGRDAALLASPGGLEEILRLYGPASTYFRTAGKARRRGQAA